MLAVTGTRAQYTEIPETVAPGRFLLEMDALSLRLDREGRDKLTAIGAASTFVTAGLTPDWDVQLGAQFFVSQRITTAGLTDRRSGVGDVYVRTKWRFLDDRLTGTSAALIPFVKIPTNSGGVGNDSVEGGVIVPVRTALPGGLDFAAMAGLDLRRNDADDGYDSYWYSSAKLGFSLTRSLSLYGEASLAKSSGGAPWEGSMGAGVLLFLREQLWWDFALYRGLLRGATDWNPIVRFNVGF